MATAVGSSAPADIQLKISAIPLVGGVRACHETASAIALTSLIACTQLSRSDGWSGGGKNAARRQMLVILEEGVHG